jgi:hypothetical protein
MCSPRSGPRPRGSDLSGWAAGDLTADGRIDNAGRALAGLHEQTDGLPDPDGWVTGTGAHESASSLQYPATVYGCTG